MDAADMWTETWDTLNGILRDREDELSLEDQIEITKTMALLSIAQELSRISNNGIPPHEPA